MGGVKKKSLASMEKKQESEDTAQQTGEAPKGKRTTEQKVGPQQHKRLSFILPKMTKDETMKCLFPLGAITIYTASRALGVNASIATGILRDLEESKMISRAGGSSGHMVWSAVSKS